MLPNNFKLFQATEDKFKKLKTKTGLTPNVSARIAFFSSIEGGYKYILDDQKPSGSLALSKTIWFGDYESLVETLLRDFYPDLDDESLVKAWASHVKHGESELSLALIR